VPYTVTVSYGAADGGTKMTTMVEGEPTGFFKIAEGMVARVLKGPVPYTVTVSYGAADGGTKMTTMVEGEPTGFFKIAEGMVASQLEKSLGENGELLKKILEG